MPFLPIILVVASIMAISSPSLSSVLVYDRELVQSGELWRLVTCHVVHFSLSHLFWNMCGLLVPVWHVGRDDCRHLNLLIGITALATSGAVFIFQPDMNCYGGLSGIVIALMVFVGCREMLDRQPSKLWWMLMLAATCMNIGYEFATGHTSLAAADDKPFVPAILVHIVGALIGASAAAFSPLRTITAFSDEV